MYEQKVICPGEFWCDIGMILLHGINVDIATFIFSAIYRLMKVQSMMFQLRIFI